MNQFLSILKQLGVNRTIGDQLLLFLICYFFLSRFLFKPYLANLDYRKKNTVGNADEATRLNTAAEHLAMDYQGQVKAQNEKATAIYDKLKAEGLAEEDRLVAAARAQGSDVLDQTRALIQKEMGVAKTALKEQIPQLVRQIASRVLGREIS